MPSATAVTIPLLLRTCWFANVAVNRLLVADGGHRNCQPCLKQHVPSNILSMRHFYVSRRWASQALIRSMASVAFCPSPAANEPKVNSPGTARVRATYPNPQAMSSSSTAGCSASNVLSEERMVTAPRANSGSVGGQSVRSALAANKHADFRTRGRPGVAGGRASAAAKTFHAGGITRRAGHDRQRPRRAQPGPSFGRGIQGQRAGVVQPRQACDTERGKLMSLKTEPALRRRHREFWRPVTGARRRASRC